MENTTNPKFIMQYVVEEETLSSFLRKMRFQSDSGQGEMRLLELYPGIQIWTIDFHMEQLDILCLQYAVLPAAPRWAATSFSIFVNYARRMLPCLMAGVLMLRRTPLRYLIVGLRKLRLPQNLIIAISVTLRYFPAIREEVGYIRDAMKLRNIRGLRKIECLVVPLMVSATGTAEELSAAAVTRGIENPVRKTSVIQLHAPSMDLIGLAAGVMLTAAAFLIGSR